MAILRINDGKSFQEGQQVHKDRVGFRDDQDNYFIRYEELPKIWKHFDCLNVNHMQFQGKVIESIKAEKVARQIKNETTVVMPVSQKTQEMAAKYRAKLAQGNEKVE